MRVLVTGGGGFLGRNLALRLHSRGDQVTILGRSNYLGFVKGIQVLKVDLCDSKAAEAAFVNQEVVFHAAAMPGIWGDKKDFYASNVEATSSTIEGCKKHRVRKLIYTSSPSVVMGNSGLEYADETKLYPVWYSCEYPRTKAIAERMVLEANGKK